MRVEVHGKSLLLGLALGAAIVGGIAAKSPDPRLPAGRFEMHTVVNDKGIAAYVLDTATGQVWNSQNSSFPTHKSTGWDSAKVGNTR